MTTVSYEQTWERVDAYLQGAIGGEDEALARARSSIKEAGLPAINVTPLEGQFLYVLARLSGARHVLEVGTLAGYSTIWLARALPEGGHLVTLEVEPRHAEVARANIERAGLDDVVEVRVGPALELLPQISSQHGPGYFDLAFIDADKPNNAAYFSWATKLVRQGGAIVVDNVVREGRVADPAPDEADIVGTRQLFDAISASPGVVASALQTVGPKGYDGLAVAVVGAGSIGSGPRSAGLGSSRPN
jgi:predicted O-methyltransferase YrrM